VYCLCVILCIVCVLFCVFLISSFLLVLNAACNLLGCSPACGIHIHSPMKMEQAQCSETSVIKHHTPGNNPKDYTQHSVYFLCVILCIICVIFCVLFVCYTVYYLCVILCIICVLFCVLFVCYSVYYLCVILCIVCVLFCVLFVCKCVLYCCHQVSTKLLLNIHTYIYIIFKTRGGESP
jgi:hypothetical protein